MTEGHYFELAANQSLHANQAVLDPLMGDDTLLIIGMSLNDPNLRRLLHERRNRGLANSKDVYAVLKEEDDLVTDYQSIYWRSRDVKLIWVRDYDEIESMLRQIKFGPYEPPTWFKTALAWMQARNFPDRFYTDEWQESSHKALARLKAQIDLLFPRAYGEVIELNLLAPRETTMSLGLVARTQDRAASGQEAIDRANLFRFGVNYLEEGGSSGLAFVRGQPDEAIDEADWAHRNIPRDTIKIWYQQKGFRDWRSIISIPILDSKDWKPIGVVSITSNFPKPFWGCFGDQKDRLQGQLKAIVRGAVSRFLFCAP